MTTPRQTCTTCAHLQKCWALRTHTGKPISKNNIVINKLICCLQLGIKKDQAAANLINMYKPGMMRLISNARQSNIDPNMDVEQLFNDMSSTMIEYLMHDYKIGDRGRATPYLFDPQQGFMTKWIKWILSKNRRFYTHHELFSVSDEHDEEGTKPWDSAMSGSTTQWRATHGNSYNNHEYVHADNELEAEASERSRQIMTIIEDGITLNSNEYRVMKFCMVNANETNASRFIDGLHIRIAQLMGVSRPRATRLYRRATHKLRDRYKETVDDV